MSQQRIETDQGKTYPETRAYPWLHLGPETPLDHWVNVCKNAFAHKGNTPACLSWVRAQSTLLALEHEKGIETLSGAVFLRKILVPCARAEGWWAHTNKNKGVSPRAAPDGFRLCLRCRQTLPESVFRVEPAKKLAIKYGYRTESDYQGETLMSRPIGRDQYVLGNYCVSCRKSSAARAKAPPPRTPHFAHLLAELRRLASDHAKKGMLRYAMMPQMPIYRFFKRWFDALNWAISALNERRGQQGPMPQTWLGCLSEADKQALLALNGECERSGSWRGRQPIVVTLLKNAARGKPVASAIATPALNEAQLQALMAEYNAKARAIGIDAPPKAEPLPLTEAQARAMLDEYNAKEKEVLALPVAQVPPAPQAKKKKKLSKAQLKTMTWQEIVNYG